MHNKGRLIELSQGVYVERDMYNVVKKLRDYDSNLRVKFLNDSALGVIGDAPYAIFELCPDGIERLVFTTWELDDRVLDRIFAADTVRHNVLDKIDINNAATVLADQRLYRERNLEIKDIVTSTFKSPKGKYSFDIDGKHIEIDDDPRTKAKITPSKGTEE